MGTCIFLLWIWTLFLSKANNHKGEECKLVDFLLWIWSFFLLKAMKCKGEEWKLVYKFLLWIWTFFLFKAKKHKGKEWELVYLLSEYGLTDCVFFLSLRTGKRCRLWWGKRARRVWSADVWNSSQTAWLPAWPNVARPCLVNLSWTMSGTYLPEQPPSTSGLVIF